MQGAASSGRSRYIAVRVRFLREHPGHALENWPLPPIDFL
jgi:hypothetical protein